MPILPIAEFEADLAAQDRELYEKMKPPSSVVVKFGSMGLIGEFPYGIEEKPGCGTKFVLKTHRGTELGEMLTSTCPNSGCGKSISRKEMLEYIERSGGKDYPFFSMQGKVLRIATVEDLNQQARLEQTRPAMVRHAKGVVEQMKLPMKLVDAEPILGGEKVTFYFLSEERLDFRELVAALAAEHNTRIEMRQVGSRDEARLTADYEKCGQHCCCKQFLKVLKPVSMKNAKIQKATLDPLKISGRCGRLMCCLRYEESSYDELRARLPKKRTRVSGEFGTGFVLDTQILTQLCLVQLDDKDERIAVALEELTILGPGAPPNQQSAKQQSSKSGQDASRPGASGVQADVAADAEESDEPEADDRPSEGSPGAGSGARAPEAPQQQQQQQPPARREERRDDRRPPQQGQPGNQARSGQRPQWPTGGKPNRPAPPAPSSGSGQQAAQGSGGGARPDRPQEPRPQSQRPPQQPQQQPPRPPQQNQPMRPPQQGSSQQGQPAQGPRDEIDDILADLDTDFGDGPSRGPGPGQGGGAPGEGGRRRKRKRRRGGGGGGGGGGPPGPPPA